MRCRRSASSSTTAGCCACRRARPSARAASTRISARRCRWRRRFAHCETIYAQHGLPPLFRMTPFDQPPDLEDALAARGYVAFDDDAGAGVDARRAAPDVPAHDDEVERHHAGRARVRRRGRRPARVDRRAARRASRAPGALAARRQRFVAVHAAGASSARRRSPSTARSPAFRRRHRAEHARGRGYRDACLRVAAVVGVGARRARTPICRSTPTTRPRSRSTASSGSRPRIRYHYRGRAGRVRMIASEPDAQ